MTPIANVNGVNVYSDKSINGISGTRITFSDGSWCDTSSKQIVNQGPGFISLGEAPEGAPGEAAPPKAEKVGPTPFAAKAVDIRGIAADVKIEVGESPSFAAEGPGAEGITFGDSGETLTVRGKSGKGAGGSIASMMSGDFTSISIGGSSMVFHGGGMRFSRGGSLRPKVTITVTKGTKVSIDDVSGEVSIGDTDGAVEITASGQREITAGKVAEAVINVSGQVEVKIESVSKALVASATGQSKITAKGGSVENLSATAVGQSRVRFNGNAKNATLTATGQSTISVRHVDNRPTRSATGQSEIEVENRD